MNATVKLDGCTVLRIGNDLELPQGFQPRGYVALILEHQPLNGPGDSVPPVEKSTLGVLTPSAARAMASIILSAATEARG